MSSGGGGYSSGPVGHCPCNQLVFSAVLKSPDVSKIRHLKVGDDLSLGLVGPQGPVVAKHSKVGEVGSVVNRIFELIRCIDDGYEYVATVASISGSQVTVEVRPV